MRNAVGNRGNNSFRFDGRNSGQRVFDRCNAFFPFALFGLMIEVYKSFDRRPHRDHVFLAYFHPSADVAASRSRV